VLAGWQHVQSPLCGVLFDTPSFINKQTTPPLHSPYLPAQKCSRKNVNIMNVSYTLIFRPRYYRPSSQNISIPPPRPHPPLPHTPPVFLYRRRFTRDERSLRLMATRFITFIQPIALSGHIFPPPPPPPLPTQTPRSAVASRFNFPSQ